MTIEEKIKEIIGDKVFSEMQKWEIKRGFELHLTMEQIKLYAKEKYSWDQMQSIRGGFYENLTIEQVKVYANPKFNHLQMYQIYLGLYNGVNIDFVKFYADEKYSSEQMNNIRLGFEQKLTMEQVKFYADLEHDSEMEEMRLAFEKGGTGDQVKILKMYADGDYYLNKMCQIVLAFEEGLTVQDLSAINPEMGEYEIETKIEKLIKQKKGE